MEPLDSLSHLRDLNLAANQIVDVASLGNLNNLTALNLSVNPIANATPLAHLKSLRVLHLNANLPSLSPDGMLQERSCPMQLKTICRF